MPPLSFAAFRATFFPVRAPATVFAIFSGGRRGRCFAETDRMISRCAPFAGNGTFA
jgi:hypothetical protein